MKKFRSAAAAAIAVICGVMPMTSSAASVKIQGEPASKDASMSSISLSSPRFSMMETTEGGKLSASPQISSISTAAAKKYADKEFPSAYDLRDIKGVTSVKDQQGYGTCWAFSALASAETSILKSNPRADLSEMHTAYYAYYGDDQIPCEGETVGDILLNGGTCHAAANLMSQWIGPVNELRIPYGRLFFFEDEERVANMKNVCDYHLKNAYIFGYDKDRSDVAEVNNIIKSFVHDGLAVDISFHSDDTLYYSYEYSSARSVRKPRFANHSVVIVGWDDNFSRNNFAVHAENDGAWLVKNSWGTDSYDRGYMWISYDDMSLCEFSVFELDDVDEYKYNAHNDTFVPIQSLSAQEEGVDGPSYAANVFYTPETMQAEALNIHFPQSETEYEITLYTGLTDVSIPTSGKASATTKGVQSIPGTVTIELDENVVINGGDYYSVVVKLYSAESPYVVPVESVLYLHDDVDKVELGTFTTYDNLKAHTAANESFYSADGYEWIDPVYEDYTYDEWGKQEVLEQLEYELFDGIYPEETDLLEEAQTAFDLFEELFAIADLSIAIGNIPIKVLGNPVNKVDFSLMNGFVQDGEPLELSVKDGAQVHYSVNGGEYVEYTQPIEMEGYTRITATVDFKTFTERCYIAADFIPETGDVNASGAIDSSDASDVLAHYASISTGGSGTLKNLITNYSDINGDSVIDSADASEILEIYAIRST